MSLERRLQRLEAEACRREIAEAIKANNAPASVTVDRVLAEMIQYLTLPLDAANTAYPEMACFSEDDRAEVRRRLPTFERARLLR